MGTRKSEKAANYRLVDFKHITAYGPKSDMDPDERVAAFRTDQSAKLFADVYLGKKEAEAAQSRANLATFGYHMLPFGAFWDNLTQGDIGEAVLSGVGDVATWVLPGAGYFAKAEKTRRRLKIARVGLEAGVGSVRAAQGIFAVIDGDGDKAAGYLGEATLRLLGVGVDTIAALKKTRTVGKLGKTTATAKKAEKGLEKAAAAKTGRLIDRVVGTDALGGKIYTPEQLRMLEKQIERMSEGKVVAVRNSALLKEIDARAAFISPENLQRVAKADADFITRHGLQDYVKSGRGLFLVGEEATYNKVAHEAFHLQHWKSNPAAYSGLTTFEKEKYVFEQIVQDHIWKSLKSGEREVQIKSFLGALVESNLSASEKTEIINTLVKPAFGKLHQ